MKLWHWKSALLLGKSKEKVILSKLISLISDLNGLTRLEIGFEPPIGSFSVCSAFVCQ